MTYAGFYTGERVQEMVKIAMKDLLIKEGMYFKKDDEAMIAGFICGNYMEDYLLELDCVELLKIARKEAEEHFGVMNFKG